MIRYRPNPKSRSKQQVSNPNSSLSQALLAFDKSNDWPDFIKFLNKIKKVSFAMHEILLKICSQQQL